MTQTLQQMFATLTALLFSLQVGVGGLPSKINVATIGQVLGASTESLFTTQTPATLHNSDGPYELGTRFTSATAGQITSIRFYKDSLETGAHTGHIWDVNGSLLATVIFSGESASGWQQQSLPSPLNITANTIYTVSVNTGGSYYVATDSGLQSKITSGSLSSVVGSNGTFGSVNAYPTQNWMASNYFRDVVFTAGAPAPSDTTAPTTPTSLSATAVSSSAINLSWTASTDAVGLTGYKIYRAGTQIGTSVTNSYSDSGLTASTNYFYTVSAYDASSNTSAQSMSASATTQTVVVSNGGNWYVRAGASGNGTSWASAWGNVTNITWSSIQPGDTIWISGGNYGSLSIGKSGNADTVAGRIFIKRSTTSGHGSDTGWSSSYDAQVVLSSIQWDSLNVGSYVTIDGQVPSGIYISMTSGNSSLVDIQRGNNYITIKYLDLKGPCGTAPCFQGGDNRMVDTTAWNGSSYEVVSNFKLQNSKLHGGCTLFWAMNIDNAVIENNEFYNNDATDWQPPNECHANIVATSESSNVTFRYNTIHNYSTEGIMMISGNSGTWYIYGNLWYDAGEGITGYNRVVESQDGTNGPVYLYNNTMVGLYNGVNSANGGIWANGSTAKNNIWWNMGDASFSGATNEFCSSACSGTNSISNGSNPFVNLGAKDYRLVSNVGNTYPKDKGANLGSPYNVDLSGNIRGSDGVWDIGAYEYMGSVVTPPSSTKFTAGQRVQTTSNLNVRATASASGTLLGTQNLSSLGTIVSGGQSVDGYYWWNVNFDNAPDGYSGEGYLTAYSTPSTPIVGDFNGDGLVNSIDLSLMTTAWNTLNTTYDLNRDGLVNSLDYTIMVQNWSL